MSRKSGPPLFRCAGCGEVREVVYLEQTIWTFAGGGLIKTARCNDRPGCAYGEAENVKIATAEAWLPLLN